MIPTSFRTRSVVFAYLFGPPRLLSRQEGVAVYDAVCTALGVDDLTFRYGATESGDVPATTAERSRGFSVQIERKMGRGSYKVTIDNSSVNQPIRFLAEYLWPPSREHVSEDFDATAEAVFGALTGQWQRVLAETRIRGQLEAAGGSALAFLSEQALRIEPNRLALLEAAPQFVGISLETPPGDPTEADPLHQPKREISLQVLREDKRSVYVELMSQWPQLAIVGQGEIEVDARRIRSFDHAPSAYIRNSVDYLQERVLQLFA